MAKILREAQPTPFAFESACRHGIRSGFCLEGWSWASADATAADIVLAALNRVGAKRPTWEQGQPEHAQQGFAPVEYTRCARCSNPMPAEPYSGKYCSRLCYMGNRVYWEWNYERGKTFAEYWAALAAAGAQRRKERERPCETCGKPFSPRSNVEDIRHCSRECADKVRGGKLRLPKRRCDHCRKLFQPISSKRRFCSPECYQADHHIKPRPCEWCVETFTPASSSRGRFCSTSCSAQWRIATYGPGGPKPKERLLRPCEECGEPFDPQYNKARRFCSLRCSSRWNARMRGFDVAAE